MNDDNRTTYRLGRRPSKQGPRPLPSNEDRIEKLATEKPSTTTGLNDTNRTTGITIIKINDGLQRLKATNDTFTVGTWNVQTLDNRKVGTLKK